MVVIRFKRLGTKKTPHHRIVVTEHTRAQSSRELEVVGFYDPSQKPERFSVKEDRIKHWVDSGAKISESLQRMIKRHTKAKAVASK